jgi:threonine dehydrogenase-like Zn-dependent dehydrogenase
VRYDQQHRLRLPAEGTWLVTGSAAGEELQWRQPNGLFHSWELVRASETGGEGPSANKGIRGGPAPVRAYLPHLLDLVWTRQIRPGKVFDLTLPLSAVAEAYRAMDERRAIKVLLQP